LKQGDTMTVGSGGQEVLEMDCACPPEMADYSASVGFVIREWHLVAKRNEIKHSARVVFY
jgi:hypothetical protein